MKKTQQRIRLRPDGSPVKLDATILECDPTATIIKVRFDGPIEDTWLYAFGVSQMLSDMKDMWGNATDDVRRANTSKLWHVL